MKLDNSQALYERALKTIPMATQTFSKSAQNFVRGACPLFLERGDGGRVWDVDGNVYLDYLLGLLPIVLGYRDPDVDGAIRDQLERGIVFSLATELEAEVAELLVRLIPCAEQVRFGKNGSDATSAAIRLARWMTRRDKVIACGYHGWHDWYIGTTARHFGVPEAVRALTTAVDFDDVDALDQALAADPGAYACIILEPDGAHIPSPGYLKAVQDLARGHGSLLVFDEIVSGFRAHLGGAQVVHGVTPDLACFGKSMANGMPISAVVGPRDLMKGMEDVFFSGTFGGECLSLAAAKATIGKLEREDGPGRLTALGRRLRAVTEGIIGEIGLGEQIGFMGADWCPRLQIRDPGPAGSAVATSLLRQELVGAGLLMGMAFNLCLAHDDEAVIADTERSLRAALGATAEALASPDPRAFLRGDLIQPTFQVRR